MNRKFEQYVANMGIIIKNLPIEIYHFIGIVEHYHGHLQRVYTILITQILGIYLNLALQMSLKAIKNLLSFYGLVFSILVFGKYL